MGKVHAGFNASFWSTLRCLPHDVLYRCGGEGGAHLALHRPAVCFFPGMKITVVVVCKLTSPYVRSTCYFPYSFSCQRKSISYRITKYLFGSKMVKTVVCLILLSVRLHQLFYFVLTWMQLSKVTFKMYVCKLIKI